MEMKLVDVVPAGGIVLTSESKLSSSVAPPECMAQTRAGRWQIQPRMPVWRAVALLREATVNRLPSRRQSALYCTWLQPRLHTGTASIAHGFSSLCLQALEQAGTLRPVGVCVAAVHDQVSALEQRRSLPPQKVEVASSGG